jgi:1-acyl-sn-glycerol-3-phosphate acyltransferase
MTLVRSLIYVIYLYGTMALCVIALAPLALLAPRQAILGPQVWARVAIWGLRAICGARVRVEGAENVPPGGVLVASKHQAMLDTLTPFLVLKRPAIVLKKELLSMPLFGWFAQRTGMIAIDREGHASALKQMLRDARARAGEGREIVIYPEGTRPAWPRSTATSTSRACRWR